MKEINLYDFALTGDFGTVKIGMTKDEIIEILGKPDSDDDYQTGSSGLLYGWYEFFYWTENKTLYAIQNDHLDYKNLGNFEYSNSKVRFDPWIFSKQLSLSETKNVLKKQNIQFKIVDFSDRKIIELNSGFIIDFDNETWSESKSNWIKISDFRDYKMIGFRFFKQ